MHWIKNDKSIVADHLWRHMLRQSLANEFVNAEKPFLRMACNSL